MTNPFDQDAELAEYTAAQRREYSKWEAKQEIFHGNARAYNAGDPVPASNVQRLGYAKNNLVQLQAGWIDDNPDDEDVKAHKKAADRQAKAHTGKADAEAQPADEGEDTDTAAARATGRAARATKPSTDKE